MSQEPRVNLWSLALIYNHLTRGRLVVLLGGGISSVEHKHVHRPEILCLAHFLYCLLWSIFSDNITIFDNQKFCI